MTTTRKPGQCDTAPRNTGKVKLRRQLNYWAHISRRTSDPANRNNSPSVIKVVSAHEIGKPRMVASRRLRQPSATRQEAEVFDKRLHGCVVINCCSTP